jgi:hypothetical protein
MNKDEIANKFRSALAGKCNNMNAFDDAVDACTELAISFSIPPDTAEWPSDLIDSIDKIIIDWSKSGNENTTYCAHLIETMIMQSRIKKEGWVSVGKELPKDGHVLLYDNEVSSSQPLKYRILPAEVVRHCNDKSSWMPLPQPPDETTKTV